MADTPKKPGGKRVRRQPDPAKDRSHLRFDLAIGKLPHDSMHVENRINAFRRTLEDLVVQRHGSVSLAAAAAVNSACRWERHALLALRLMRTAHPLPAETALRFSETIAKASSERDRAIQRLDLDSADPLAGLLPEADR